MKLNKFPNKVKIIICIQVIVRIGISIGANINEKQSVNSSRILLLIIII